MHSNCWKNGPCSIEELRTQAEAVKAAYLSGVHNASSQPLAAWLQHQNPRVNPEPSSSKFSGHGAVSNPGPAIGGQQSALDALEQLRAGVEYDPAGELPKATHKRVPRYVCNQLESSLRKGGLLTVLQEHPDRFRVTLRNEKTAKGNPKYTFSLIAPRATRGAGASPTPPAPTPAIGGSSSSSSTRAMPVPPPPLARAPLGVPLPPGPSGAVAGQQPPPPSFPRPAGLVDGVLRAPTNADPCILAWKVDDVVAYAEEMELLHLEDLIRREGVDGQVLLQSSHMDLMVAGFTMLQARKLLTRLPFKRQPLASPED